MSKSLPYVTENTLEKTRTFADILFQDSSDMDTRFVNTINGIEQLIEDLPASTSLLYIDVQGRKSAGQNVISILTILPAGSNTIYIIDVDQLGGIAFVTKGPGGDRTIRSILESPDVTKVFFFMRNPHGLWAADRIRLQGAEDIHIMENAYRAMIDPDSPSFTLMECVQKDLTNCPVVLVPTFCQQAVTFSKLSDDVLFDRSLHRSPPPDITNYCSSVVFVLQELRNMYWGSLTTYLKKKVDQKSQERVELLTLDTTPYSPLDVDNLPNSWEV
jgi:hypothetical protein